MMGLIITGCVLLFVLCFFALTPLVIEIDSRKGIYEVKLTGIARLNAEFKENALLLHICVMGWRKTVDPFAETSSKMLAVTHKKAKRRKRDGFLKSHMSRRVRNIIRSFKIKQLYINVDTGDYLVNSWLYPIMLYGRSKGKQLYINYYGEVEVKMKIMNNMASIFLATIKSV